MKKPNCNLILIVAALAAFSLAGCGRPKPVWRLRQVPTTDTERKAVAEHVEKIMAATPRSLGGNDQDWDDAIAAAQKSALETLCRPSLWELATDSYFAAWDYTGRWKYADEAGGEAAKNR